MRTRAEADEMAARQLSELQKQADVELIFVGDTLERQTAWVYFYESAVYVSSGNIGHALAGNAPIVVPKGELEPWLASTGVCIEDQVE